MISLLVFATLIAPDWDFADPVRYVGAAVALICLWLWSASMVHQWSRLHARGHRINLAICGLLLASAARLIEAAKHNVPFGWGVALVVLSLFGLLGALVYRWSDEP